MFEFQGVIFAFLANLTQLYNPPHLLHTLVYACETKFLLCYFGMKKKESDEQRANSAMIFNDYHWQGTVRTAKELCSYCHNCIGLVSMRFVFFHLNWIPMGYIMSYIQPVVTIVFLV